MVHKIYLETSIQTLTRLPLSSLSFHFYGQIHTHVIHIRRI